MKKWVVLLAVLVAVPSAIACDMTVSCPVDGALMVKVSEDVANGRVIATYEHRTTAGSVHRATKACN